MSSGAVIEINLAALQYNLQRVRSIVGKSYILAMIKANAYGHGSIEAARALSDADGFGVASVEEAITLREAGVSKPIIVMRGFCNKEELLLFPQHNLQPVIHQQLHLDLLKKITLPKPIQAWIKIDTGMHRLGFVPSQFQQAWDQLQQCASVQQPVTIMSHFAESYRPESDYTAKQIDTFNNATLHLAAAKSIENSAAILTHPEAFMQWVRPGIMLYGVSPFDHSTAAQHDLKPVMTFSAPIMTIKNLKKGDCVSYGCTFRCPEDMSVGIIAAGYGDGYPRHVPTGTPVLVNGALCPLIGHVTMDMIMVDLRTQPQAQVGDRVVLWGEGLPAEIIAEKSGTIAYELFCQITSRVQREYI